MLQRYTRGWYCSTNDVKASGSPLRARAMRLFPSVVISLLVGGGCDFVPETSNRFGNLGRQRIVLVPGRDSLQRRKMGDLPRASGGACNVRLQAAFPIRAGDRISHSRCRHDDAEARRDEKSSRWTYAPA